MKRYNSYSQRVTYVSDKVSPYDNLIIQPSTTANNQQYINNVEQDEPKRLLKSIISKGVNKAEKAEISSDEKARYDECMNSPKRLKKLCKRGYCSAKAKFDVYPSAVANIYAGKVCNGTIKGVDDTRELDEDYAIRAGIVDNSSSDSNDDLKRWLDEKWVDVCSSEPSKFCGRNNKEQGLYPYCRPSVRVSEKTPKTVGESTPEELQAMCILKNIIPEGVDRKPTRLMINSEETKTIIEEMKNICKQKGIDCADKLNEETLKYLVENMKTKI